MYIPVRKGELEEAEKACSLRVSYDEKGFPNVAIDFDKNRPGVSTLLELTGGCATIPPRIQEKALALQRDLDRAYMRRIEEQRDEQRVYSASCAALAAEMSVPEFMRDLRKYETKGNGPEPNEVINPFG